MKHSIKQLPWLLWKEKQFTNITGRIPFHVQEETIKITNPITSVVSTTNKIYTKIHYQSRALVCLTKFQQEISTNNKLDFSKPWLHAYTTDISLMVWWFDDGGLIGKGNRKGKLSTHGFGFDLKNLYYLQNFLKIKWQISTSICSNTYNNTTYYYLQLNTKKLKRLLCIIMKHIPIKGMLYKALLIYDDPKLQQDWISTMFKEIKPDLHKGLKKLIRKKLPGFNLSNFP
jgi:hypothetical protein